MGEIGRVSDSTKLRDLPKKKVEGGGKDKITTVKTKDEGMLQKGDQINLKLLLLDTFQRLLLLVLGGSCTGHSANESVGKK